MSLDRRSLLAAFGVLGCAAHGATPTVAPVHAGSSYRQKLSELERETRGQIGVAAWDLERDLRVEYRQHERFLLCSTFKLALAGAVLKRVDAGQEQLERRVAYDASALLDNSSITREHVGEGGMSVGELCKATVTVSDNAAANLLLASIGGPAELTAFFRELGDDVSRLDRFEPELNEYTPGDERDTTTPAAMLHTAAQLLTAEKVLSEASRRQLGDWLASASTGLKRLRAALPPQLRSGDKTGTGEYGATNDVAIAWRPSAKPVLVATYSFGLPGNLDARSEIIARVGHIVVEALGLDGSAS